MQRLDPRQLFLHVRGALAASPVPLRVALGARRSAERRIALDQLSRAVAASVHRFAEDAAEEAPGGPLPLFPELTTEEDPPMPTTTTIEQSTSFARWLLDQAKREDAVGALARQAKADPGFPRDGDPRAVSRRLNELQAEGDIHVALDEAELDWLAM